MRATPVIAVVDDDTAFINMMCDLLSDEGYQIVCCLHGHEAQATIRNNKPDLVILDIRLERPEAGWETLQLMRHVPATKNIPVIVCSADSYFLRANEQQLRKNQAEILPKPFNLDELLTKIMTIIGPPVLLEAEV